MTDLDVVLMPLLFLGVPVAAGWAYTLRQMLRAVRRATRQGESGRWQLAGASAVLIAGLLATFVVPPWFQAFVSPSLIRRTEIWLLGVAEIGYGASILIASFALIPLLVVGIRKRKPEKVWSRAVRYLALSLSILLAGGMAEGVAMACLWASSIPMPWLPVRFADQSGDNVVDILVIGESSAQGVPYERWLSVADIVAWKLRAAFPRLTFRVENQATAGYSLQAMHTRLAAIRRRPDLVILYAGHNEFQSRFDWGHGAYHYTDETPPTVETVRSVACRISPLVRLMEETARRLRISAPPARVVTRRLVDVPVCTPEQYAERLWEFRTRLGAIVSYLEWVGAQVVLVIPPGNEAGFEPNRSFLPADTPRAEREAFASEFLAARRDETTNPAKAEEVYRRLLERAPGFAETHFRLARLLESAGQWDEAFGHYVAARDLDGLPMRLPSDFQKAYEEVAARHRRSILVNGPAEFHAKGDHGLIDDAFFADGLHPSLNGYTVLAQAILTALREHHIFGWSGETPLPLVTPTESAKKFQMDGAKWKDVCGYSGWFYNRTAFIRHDPAERLAKVAIYAQAVAELNEGVSVESLRIPGVGPRAESAGAPRD